MLNTLEINGKIQKLTKEVSVKKSQINMLEPKNTVTKVKKLMGGLNNRMEMTDEIGT